MSEHDDPETVTAYFGKRLIDFVLRRWRSRKQNGGEKASHQNDGERIPMEIFPEAPIWAGVEPFWNFVNQLDHANTLHGDFIEQELQHILEESGLDWHAAESVIAQARSKTPTLDRLQVDHHIKCLYNFLHRTWGLPDHCTFLVSWFEENTSERRLEHSCSRSRKEDLPNFLAEFPDHLLLGAFDDVQSPAVAAFMSKDRECLIPDFYGAVARGECQRTGHPEERNVGSIGCWRYDTKFTRCVLWIHTNKIGFFSPTSVTTSLIGQAFLPAWWSILRDELYRSFYRDFTENYTAIGRSQKDR